MAKFLGTTGLQHLWAKIKEYANITTNGSNTTITIGGSSITAVPTSRKVNNHALTEDITISASDVGLGNVTDGAEINQNAFSNVKVGTSTIEADTKTDTIELVAGTAVTLTPDTTNDKVTIASSDTLNTAGSTDSSSKLYLIGATSQAANPQTYSQDTAYVDTDGHLYSNSIQVVNLSGNQALTNKTYNGLTLTKAATGFTLAGGTTSKTLTVNEDYTLGNACAKTVDSSISSSSSTNLPTSAAVATYVDTAISTAVVDAAKFQGTTDLADDGTASTGHWKFADLTNYKKGWYWVVATSGTYAGKVCEPGDMIFCVSNYSSAYSANDFSAVQNNIEEMSNTDVDNAIAASSST